MIVIVVLLLTLIVFELAAVVRKVEYIQRLLQWSAFIAELISIHRRPPAETDDDIIRWACRLRALGVTQNIRHYIFFISHDTIKNLEILDGCLELIILDTNDCNIQILGTRAREAIRGILP